MFLCRIGLHAWGKWKPIEHYLEVSRSPEGVGSTILMRRCERCGLVKDKIMYGIYIPLNEGE